MVSPIAAMVAVKDMMKHNEEGAATPHHPVGPIVTREDQQNLLPIIDLDDDMEFLCEAMRINDNTRALLTYFDARTVEDFALMAPHEFEAMMEYSARCKRPFPPLQQRKVNVLLQWLREMIRKNVQAGHFRENQGVDISEFRRFTIYAKEDRRDRIPPSIHEEENEEKLDEYMGDLSKSFFPPTERRVSCVFETDDEKYSLLPPAWRREFEVDLPKLKKDLRDSGESSSWSVWTSVVLSIRWAICGYDS